MKGYRRNLMLKDVPQNMEKKLKQTREQGFSTSLGTDLLRQVSAKKGAHEYNLIKFKIYNYKLTSYIKRLSKIIFNNNYSIG